MLSNKIYNHFLKELTKYFLLVLFTFSVIVWSVQSVNYLDLIVEDGHAVSVYLNYSLLNMPKILTKFIPLSFMLGLFLTILKFEDESEFLILWTFGLNKMNVVNFFFKISILVLLIQLFFAAILNPLVLGHSRSIIKSSDLGSVSSIIKTNQFNDGLEGLTIYIEERTKDNVMKNIFIRDDNNILKGFENSKESGNLTIVAKRGKLINNKNDNYLLLEEGKIQNQKKKCTRIDSDNVKCETTQDIQSINFKKTRLLVEGMKTKTITQPKIQETSTDLLLKCLLGKDSNKKFLNCPKTKSKIDVISEINRRFGMPLYIPFLSLLISFLLISRVESKGKIFYKYLYFTLAFLILIFAEIFVRYSGKSYFYAYAYYLIPVIFIPILYLLLLKKLLNENIKK